VATIERVLIIDFLDLPREQQEEIQGFEAFGNDRVLNYTSEMAPTGNELWSDILSHQAIESYWEDQSATNNYKGTLPEFIVDYGLTFDVWLLAQDFDLAVTKILVQICW